MRNSDLCVAAAPPRSREAASVPFKVLTFALNHPVNPKKGIWQYRTMHRPSQTSGDRRWRLLLSSSHVVIQNYDRGGVSQNSTVLPSQRGSCMFSHSDFSISFWTWTSCLCLHLFKLCLDYDNTILQIKEWQLVYIQLVMQLNVAKCFPIEINHFLCLLQPLYTCTGAL